MNNNRTAHVMRGLSVISILRVRQTPCQREILKVPRFFYVRICKVMKGTIIIT
ncbi:MAG: hypothetical protein IJA28_00155 [Coprobacter sp.]|nr:hypothetical protein [Coprobacter sp.]